VGDVVSLAAEDLEKARGLDERDRDLVGLEPDEAPPLGIILCAGKKQEQIELLEVDRSGIHVAEYLTVLPSREALKAKLHQSIASARMRLAKKRDEADGGESS